ncbi:MAG: CopG family transcriptional regulator [Acidobacteriia bacterium]|nr:CopG family transcriptional regulator [Terriglobia bacterium]
MLVKVRTTFELDDDLVQVAKQLAQQSGMTMGQVISRLVRRAIEPRAAPRMRNGVLLFRSKPGAKKPGMALVNRLRDEE